MFNSTNMKKIYSIVLLAVLCFSFRIFDATYFTLTTNLSQNWGTTTLISTDDDWSLVPNIQGFRGDGLTSATGADPQTILGGDDAAPIIDVNANRSDPNSFATGGVAEFDGIANPVIALSGSGTADAPYITLYLNTTGASNIRLQYNIRDLDASGDDAVQQLALQYRTGTTGNFTNIPAAFVTDATSGPNVATLVTPVNIILPAACENQATLQLRFITANAGGNDEWIGIDDIVVTPNAPSNNISVSGGGNIPEVGPAGTFILTFNPATTTTTTIDYDLTSGTATQNTDYNITVTGATPGTISTPTGTITVPAATSSVTLNITPINDANQEPAETVNISILNPTQGYSLGTTNAIANIIDDDIDPISFTGTTYLQDFNSLTSAGGSASLPIGWLSSESGPSANTSYAANTGGLNTGDTYSYGTDADRAFGGLRSGSLVPTIGAKIQNNSGVLISSLAISYRGEQWRLGSTGRNDRLDFQYSLDATSLTTGTWSDADGLDFIGPISSGATGAKDGNDPSNYVEYNFTLNGLSIPANSSFYIRWLDQDAAGADDGLSIDNFTLSLGCTPPTNQPTSLNLVPALTSISGSFSAAATGVVNADAYLVIISSAPALTQQPLNGTAYAIDDLVGNGRIIGINNSLNFSVDGLDPATTYYFFVYSNSSATSCYTIPAPLTGSISTSAPPVCTPPTIQATGINATNITSTSMDLNFTRGNGDNILIVSKTGSAVNSNPINGVTYVAGSQIGTGNFVVYNGSAATFSYSSLTQNTAYHFAVYEYSNAVPCYNTAALTGSFTTTCVTPVNVTGFSPTSQNGSVPLSWTNPTSSCFDEILVIASNAPITGDGSSFVGPGNSVYTAPEQIVFRGMGSSITVTGLTNGSNYYFKIFSRNAGNYSSGIQTTAVPFDPSTGFLYLYGNLHSHSSYSDGNKDNTAKIPADDYAFARDADCMDFLGISEHNHNTAGLNISNYPLGFAQSNAINGIAGPTGNSIISLWGMEWGTISGGGHMLVYGFDDQVIGWEPGNYNIFCEKGDYTSLLGLINNQPNAFASLAHPDATDYNNLAGTAYSATKDEAIVATAVESGPAFSTSITYNDFPASLSYLSYYKTMLAKGYRLGASMDQDNHNMTFGTANSNRLVVLSPAKTRTELVNAMRNMRFYASQDCNVRLDYKINNHVIGSSLTTAGLPLITLSVVDLDGENASSIELWGAQVGGSIPASPIKSYTAINSITFNSGDIENNQPDNTTFYYFMIVTQDDGNKIVTSPIWYSRNDLVLPVVFVNITAAYNSTSNTTLIRWSTAQEMNSDVFVIERSLDGSKWAAIGTVKAAGSSNNLRNYEFTDLSPQPGTNFYRLNQVDLDQGFIYSKVVSITTKKELDTYISLYPNPAIGFTNIYSTVSSPTKVTIQIVSSNGKLIKQTNAVINRNTPLHLDLTGINQGMYFIRILTANKTTMEKLMIK